MLEIKYDDWDSLNESVPRGAASRLSPTNVKDIPVDFKYLTGLLTSQSVSQAVSKEDLDTLGAGLWLVLAAFRRRGISVGDVRRLHDDYPRKIAGKGEQSLMDTVREHRGQIAMRAAGGTDRQIKPSHRRKAVADPDGVRWRMVPA